MGKAKFYEKKKHYEKSLEYINQVIVVFTWYTPALVEKARILAVMGDWEQGQEMAQRVSSYFDISITNTNSSYILNYFYFIYT
jgi:tetratricopeptide repeat protein 21B